MFKLLWLSIVQPRVLINVTLLSKKFIKRLLVILAIVTAIPVIANSFSLIYKTQQDIYHILPNLPEFYTQNNELVDATGKTDAKAIQSDTVYVLYDLEDTLSLYKQNHITNNHLFSIFIKKNAVTYYGLNHPLLQHKPLNASVSTDLIQQQLPQFINALNTAYLIVPIISILLMFIVVLIENFCFTTLSNICLLASKKAVRKDHLYRVSLFSSFIPYTCFSLLALCGIVIPFQFFITACFVVARQFFVLKQLHAN